MDTQEQSPSKNGMFDGRISQFSFLLGMLYMSAIFLVPIIAQLFVRMLLTSAGQTTPNAITMVMNIISLLFGVIGVLLVLPVTISLYIRRLHDLNQSGLLTLLTLLPIVNILLLLYLLFAPGTSGSNNYGNPVNSKNFLVILGLKRNN